MEKSLWFVCRLILSLWLQENILKTDLSIQLASCYRIMSSCGSFSLPDIHLQEDSGCVYFFFSFPLKRENVRLHWRWGGKKPKICKQLSYYMEGSSMKSVIQTRCGNSCEFQISDDLNSFPLFLFSKCDKAKKRCFWMPRGLWILFWEEAACAMFVAASFKVQHISVQSEAPNAFWVILTAVWRFDLWLKKYSGP